jgi:hypothetical protein
MANRDYCINPCAIIEDECCSGCLVIHLVVESEVSHDPVRGQAWGNNKVNREQKEVYF